MHTLEALTEILQRNPEATRARVREFSIGGCEFAFNEKKAIMGVINLSPDSWYRESVCLKVESAVRHGRILHEQGAAIIDVGAESTLAHAARPEETVQTARLLPVIKELRAAGVLVSVETYAPRVAEQCLAAGANVLNLTGTTKTEDLYRMVAEHKAAVIICYVQGKNVREVGDFDQREVAEIVSAASRGDFSRRIAIDGKDGFYRQLATAVNDLLNQTLSGITEVKSALKALGSGDLTHRSDSRLEGVFAEMSSNANSAIQSLQQLMAQIRHSANEITSAAGEINKGNAHLSRRSEQQAAHLEETAASMEQLAAVVRRHAEAAQTVNGLSAEAARVAADAGSAVEDVVRHESHGASLDRATRGSHVAFVCAGRRHWHGCR